tara:strand:- start:215 stop:1027 length:813 start_codon:yes stop_codon:yes gene_type:complete
MAKNSSNYKGGFDMAVLTQKKMGEALLIGASPISERVIKPRLLIISNNKVNERIPVIDKNIARPSKTLKRTNNRKRITCNDTFTHGGVTYEINNGNGKLGLFVECLRSIVEQFQIALHIWRRVFVLRFELHQPFKTDTSEQITNYRKRLFQRLKRDYGFNKIGFCWAREYHGKGKGQHYHFALFLDGNLIRHSSRINDIIRDAWERPTGGYRIGKIQRPYYLVDDEKMAQKAMYRLSYLAKVRGKGHRLKQAKDFQCSRMKLNNKKGKCL